MDGGCALGSFEIGRFICIPDRKLCGFLIEAENRPGVLSEISSVAGRHNASILYVAFSASMPTKKTATGLAFLDLTDADVSVEDLVKEGEKIAAVKSFEVIYPPVKGFIADNFSSRLLMNGERAIIMRLQGYKGLVANIRKHFGTAGETFLYYIGFDSGMEYAKSHMEMASKLGLTDPAQILKLISVNLFNCVGYGRMEIQNLKTNPPKATIRIYDSFECELGIGSGKPYSFLIRGMLAGFLTGLFNEKMNAKETQCIAKRDPYCEFRIKPERRT